VAPPPPLEANVIAPPDTSTVPIAVVNRPRSLPAPLSSRAALGLARYRVDADDSKTLPNCDPPAWVFLIGPRIKASSTAIRSARGRGVLKR